MAHGPAVAATAGLQETAHHAAIDIGSAPSAPSAAAAAATADTAAQPGNLLVQRPWTSAAGVHCPGVVHPFGGFAVADTAGQQEAADHGIGADPAARTEAALQSDMAMPLSRLWSEPQGSCGHLIFRSIHTT